MEGDLSTLPVERPAITPGRNPPGSRREFCWASLVASSIHPVKVAIVEAMLWVHEPLSASELEQLFGDGDYNLDIVLYHLRGLTRLNVMSVTDARRARGARETYFFFR